MSGRPWTVVRTAPSELLLWRDGAVRTCPGLPGAVVGDRIAIDEGQPRLLARTGVLSRASVDGTSREQVLAANVDVVLIVEPFPRPSLARIERFAVLAWSSGATPFVVLTKSDLVDPAECGSVAARVAGALPGGDVVTCSTVSGEGVDDVARSLAGRVGVLVGPSGAGKSTLVNSLAGRDLLQTGPLRADGKGRHTTSHRELVVLPGGGLLIDTPGLRAVGVTGDVSAVDEAYPDIAELAAECRFTDCTHDAEPGCAVVAAVAAGALPQRRLDSWRKLQREAQFQRTRRDARARREAERATAKDYARIGRQARQLKGNTG